MMVMMIRSDKGMIKSDKEYEQDGRRCLMRLFYERAAGPITYNI